MNFWCALLIGMYMGDIFAYIVDRCWFKYPIHFWLDTVRWVVFFLVFI